MQIRTALSTILGAKIEPTPTTEITGYRFPYGETLCPRHRAQRDTEGPDRGHRRRAEAPARATGAGGEAVSRRWVDDNGVPTVDGARAMFAAIDEAKAKRGAPVAHPTPYAWRRRSLTELDDCATITLARRTDGSGTDDLLLVVDSTHDRRRLYALDLDKELSSGLSYEEIEVGDPYVSELQLDVIQLCIEETVPHGWNLERLWGEP